VSEFPHLDEVPVLRTPRSPEGQQETSSALRPTRLAEPFDGTCRIRRAPGSGTLVSWTVPLVG